MRAPLNGSQLLLYVHQGEHFGSINLPDLKLVRLKCHCCNNVWLLRVPIDTLNANAAPKLKTVVAICDERDQLL